MKRISIRIDDNIHSKLIDQANQEGLSLSESIRTHLEKQINNETPTHQLEKTTEKQTTNKETITEEQLLHMPVSEVTKLFKKESLEEQLKKLTNTT